MTQGNHVLYKKVSAAKCVKCVFFNITVEPKTGEALKLNNTS